VNNGRKKTVVLLHQGSNAFSNSNNYRNKGPQVSAPKTTKETNDDDAVNYVQASQIMVPIAKAHELEGEIDPASLSHPTHRWTRQDAAKFGWGSSPPTQENIGVDWSTFDFSALATTGPSTRWLLSSSSSASDLQTRF